MKTSDEWAKEFKLHSCIGNKKFQKQIKKIQDDIIKRIKFRQCAREEAYSNGYEKGCRVGYEECEDFNKSLSN